MKKSKKMESQVKEYMTQAHMDTLFGEKDQKVTYSEVISNSFNLSKFRKELVNNIASIDSE